MSKFDNFQVRNTRQETGTVPAVAILIPGPCAEAVDAVIR